MVVLDHNQVTLYKLCKDYTESVGLALEHGAEPSRKANVEFAEDALIDHFSLRRTLGEAAK